MRIFDVMVSVLPENKGFFCELLIVSEMWHECARLPCSRGGKYSNAGVLPNTFLMTLHKSINTHKSCCCRQVSLKFPICHGTTTQAIRVAE